MSVLQPCGGNEVSQMSPRQRPNGFTLVELLVGIFTSLVVMGGIYSLLNSQQITFSNQEQIAEMTQNVRTVMDLMSREVRLAGYKPSGSVFNGIATAQPSTIRLLADINQDGAVAGNIEDITYSYDNGTLQILRNGVGLPVAENITNLAFLYTLADGSSSSNPGSLANIRKVRISITARTRAPDLTTGQYRTITMATDVVPRNLGI